MTKKNFKKMCLKNMCFEKKIKKKIIVDFNSSMLAMLAMLCNC